MKDTDKFDRIHVIREKDTHVRIPHSILFDARLSFSARGFAAYLLALDLPPFTDLPIPMDDEMDASLSELMTAGYARHFRAAIRRENGKVTQHREITISEAGKALSYSNESMLEDFRGGLSGEIIDLIEITPGNCQQLV